MKAPTGKLISQNVEEIADYATVILASIAPALDELRLREDARKQEDAAYDRLLRSSGCTGLDAGVSPRVAAFVKGLRYYAVAKGIWNVVVSGLWHLVEQQSVRLSDSTEPPPSRTPRRHHAREQGIEDRLARLGLQPQNTEAWGRIDKLHLVANVVKHGEGPSASKRGSRRADLFQRAGDRGQLMPLCSVGLCLEKDHFVDYVAASKRFWEQVRDQLRASTLDKP